MEQHKIGELIAKKRKEKGLTQNQLAELLGVSGKTISRWETAKYMPDLSMLIPLSEQLGISLYELLNGEEIKNNDNEINQNEIVQSVIEYTKYKNPKMKFDIWTKLLISFVMIMSLFVSYDMIKYTPNRWYNGYKEDLIKWQENFEGDVYEMAFSSKTNRVVFKYPFKALAQIKIECKDAIEFIREEFNYFPLNKYNVDDYGRMGYQLSSYTNNLNILDQIERLSSFYDIYENSFE